MEKVSTITENKSQYYPAHLKKVLKTYQKSAIKSLQGPNTVLNSETTANKQSAAESSPDIPPETPPPLPAPIQQVPILSKSDQSAELSETLIEGHRISCFIIGGEKRICFVQLLSTVLRNVNASTINNVCAELFINFSSCNSQQLLALKAKGLLPPETPTCGLVTKPDAERLCSVLLHEGALPPFNLEKYTAYSFLVYHECFSGAKGILYYELYTEKNWCVQCVVCKRFFTPQMFVCHSCYLDKKRNTIHTYIETGICHWGFDSTNWRLYLRVLEEQPDYEKCTKIMDLFKEQHKGTVITLPVKRKQVQYNNNDTVVKVVVEDGNKANLEDANEEERERIIPKKKSKVEDGCNNVVSSQQYYPASFHTYYSNLCETWLRGGSAYSQPWPPSSYGVPFTKDSKSNAYYFTDTIPSFLTQGPPILLHPERVVTLSQSEQFERTFQPNVALAPPAIKEENTSNKVKGGVIRIKSDLIEKKVPSSPSPLRQELISSYSASERSGCNVDRDRATASPSFVPSMTSTDNLVDNGVNSVVEQVAAVLDALSDAEDAVRQRVISLVQRLSLSIDRGEIERRRCQQEISHLQSQMDNLREENTQLRYDNTQLRRQLDKANSSCSSSNRSTPRQHAHCSPVSVITSPPPSITIKTEPSS